MHFWAICNSLPHPFLDWFVLRVVFLPFLSPLSPISRPSRRPQAGEETSQVPESLSQANKRASGFRRTFPRSACKHATHLQANAVRKPFYILDFIFPFQGERQEKKKEVYISSLFSQFEKQKSLIGRLPAHVIQRVNNWTKGKPWISESQFCAFTPCPLAHPKKSQLG